MKKSALIAAMALVALASASDAQASTKKCPKDSLCLWADENYEGKKLVIKEPGASNVGKLMNNEASSVKSRYSNSKSDRVLLFDKRGAKGDYLCLGGGLVRKLPQLGAPYDFDEQDDLGPPAETERRRADLRLTLRRSRA